MMKLYYLMRKLYLLKIPVIPRLIKFLIRIVYACDVFPSTDIDKGVCFCHRGLGCVIHENAIIEKNVMIFQNVTLGGNGKIHDGPQAPHICQDSIIFAGACVLGGVTIGKNCIVGANAVVLNDVPDNCIAVGVPAVIKKKSNEAMSIGNNYSAE